MMAATPSPTGPSWEVVGQAPGAILDANGQAVRGVNITYRLASGFTRTVFVPESSYTVDGARAIIAADAANAAGVESLTSGG